MLMNDALHAGKKVALALHRLIETKYPQDTYFVAFRSNAKLIKAEDLPSIVSSLTLWSTARTSRKPYVLRANS